MCVCGAYQCVQLMYTTQHRKVPPIFSHNLPTNITALVPSTKGRGVTVYKAVIKHPRSEITDPISPFSLPAPGPTAVVSRWFPSCSRGAERRSGRASTPGGSSAVWRCSLPPCSPEHSWPYHGYGMPVPTPPAASSPTAHLSINNHQERYFPWTTRLRVRLNYLCSYYMWTIIIQLGQQQQQQQQQQRGFCLLAFAARLMTFSRNRFIWLIQRFMYD